LPEFTGERVIPGLVDPDLFNEHLARYRFAARFADGAAVLDAGCGSGYGTAELARAASVAAIDISREAVAYARENFGRPEVRFVQSACEALPFADGAFDLVTAFEVIEHLERWRDFLADVRRLLRPAGILLVSTPNKAYYQEVRAQAGPNPFHCHEFEYEEFREALGRMFPHLQMWSQNHADAIVFAPLTPASSAIEAHGDSDPSGAHFFVAACSQSPLPPAGLFAWLPSTSNVLREREHHIAKLEGELVRKDAWLNELKSAHAALHESHKTTLQDLRDRTFWAQELDTRAGELSKRIRDLQEESEERLRWVQGIQADVERAHAEIERLRVREAELQATVVERTEWALNRESDLADLRKELDGRVEELRLARDQLAMVAQSKWIRLGRSLNIGPAVGE